MEYKSVDEMFADWDQRFAAKPWRYKVKVYIRRFFNRVKDNLYKVKWGLQRMFRGYDDPLLWNLSSYITRYLLLGLRSMREHGSGYPMGFDSPEEWNAILDEMITGFEAAERFVEGIHAPQEGDEELMSRALSLFQEYYLALWD